METTAYNFLTDRYVNSVLINSAKTRPLRQRAFGE